MIHAAMVILGVNVVVRFLWLLGGLFLCMLYVAGAAAVVYSCEFLEKVGAVVDRVVKSVRGSGRQR